MQLHSEEVMMGAFLKLEKHLSDWLFRNFRLVYVLFVRFLNRQHKLLFSSLPMLTVGRRWFVMWLFISVCTPGL